MFGKLGLLLPLMLAIACARPVYQEAPAQTNPANFHKLDTPVASFAKLGLKVSIAWTKQQSEDESGAFLLKFWRENAADKSPIVQDIQAAVNVRLWMPSMGHGSSPVTVQRLDVGTYLVEDVFFSMPGDWEIEVDLTNESGTVDTIKIPIHH